MAQPLWYTQTHFNSPRPVSGIKAARDIPDLPGCYVFTETRGALTPGRVLYVGKAFSLKTRVRGYLVDYMKTKATKHKGRAFIFEYRDDHGDRNLYLRWAIYGDPGELEASLIDYLRPDCNDRDEANPLADDEPLNPAYMP
jgi:hypothetical protein